MKAKRAEFVVVGAGVFGAWTSYMLRRRGHQVLLVDAYGPGNNRSSSGDESRIIRMGYGPDELYTRWASLSLGHWQKLFQVTSQPLFLNTGVLWLSTGSDPYTKLIPPILAANHIPHEKLMPNALAARFPQIALDGVDFGIFEPNSGVLLARRAVQALLDEALRLGVEHTVEAITPPVPNKPGLSEIQTRSGTAIGGEMFVFACGAWLPQLFPALLSGLIFPTRQEVFYFGTPPGARQFKAPEMPVWLHHADDMYGLPDIESRGIKSACDRHGTPFDPESGDRRVTAAGERVIRDYLRRRLPELNDPPLVESRVCLYENTSSGDFLIDRHPEIENVWLVGGGSGHGFKHGPAVGEYAASAILDAIEPEDRFSIARKLQVQERSVY
jgi:sarcosine oxidase